MTDWSNWRPLNIQSSERSEALLATKTVFKTLQHNPLTKEDNAARTMIADQRRYPSVSATQ
jgi:hypothetical protein